MTADLFEDHRVIIALAEELLAAARREPPAGADELAQLRSRLGTRAAQHLRDEDAMIVRPLFASGRIDELPGAQEAIAVIREARAHYSSHVGQWTPAAVQADREGYTEALVGMIDDLKRACWRGKRRTSTGRRCASSARRRRPRPEARADISAAGATSARMAAPLSPLLSTSTGPSASQNALLRLQQPCPRHGRPAGMARRPARRPRA